MPAIKNITTARERGLDTLRALAITAVVLFHLVYALPESWWVVTQFGWMGVDLFFVLSGYLIGSQLLMPYARGEKASVWRFYRRRAFRILPSYLVVVGLYEWWPQWREFPGFGPVWKFLTFTENFFFDSHNRSFSHVWSLCVEEHFYLVLPLLVAGMMLRPSMRRTVGLIAAIVLGGVALRWYAMVHDWDFYKAVYYPTYMRLDGLVAGVSLALVRVFRPAWWGAMKERGHATAVAGVVLVGLVVWMFGEDSQARLGMVMGLPLLAMGWGMLVMSSVSRNGWLSRARVPGARALATLAFTVYLSHKAVVHVVRVYLPWWTADRGVVAMAIYFVSVVGFAAAMHFGVERPFMALRDRVDGRSARRVEREMRAEPAL
jgi:peptidoglycan/LPS O-acetylase OafA/YrhL